MNLTQIACEQGVDKYWRKRVGVEPTDDRRGLPPSGFEDRDDHRTACASVHFIIARSQRVFELWRFFAAVGLPSVTSAGARFASKASASSIRRDIFAALPRLKPQAE